MAGGGVSGVAGRFWGVGVDRFSCWVTAGGGVKRECV